MYDDSDHPCEIWVEQWAKEHPERDLPSNGEVWDAAYETGFGEGLLEGFESGKQEGRDRAAEIILAGAQHYDDVTRGILTRFAREIRQQESADEQPCSPGQHRWKSQRQGGDPSEIGSYEWVTYCKVCGAEYDGESAGDGI